MATQNFDTVRISRQFTVLGTNPIHWFNSGTWTPTAKSGLVSCVDKGSTYQLIDNVVFLTCNCTVTMANAAVNPVMTGLPITPVTTNGRIYTGTYNLGPTYRLNSLDGPLTTLPVTITNSTDIVLRRSAGFQATYNIGFTIYYEADI